MRPWWVLGLLVTGCASLHVQATRVGVPAPPWEGPVRITATLPPGRVHQTAFFEAECRGACVGRLLHQLELTTARFGGNVGYVDRIGIRFPGAVHRHAGVSLAGDDGDRERTQAVAYEGVVTRLEGRALLVYGEAR